MAIALIGKRLVTQNDARRRRRRRRRKRARPTEDIDRLKTDRSKNLVVCL